MAGEEEKPEYLLRWKDYQLNLVVIFRRWREEKSFADVTLSCQGHLCKAHKLVLSACSTYFESLLEGNPSKYPTIILKDVPFNQLQAILDFMYTGEVTIAEDQLATFLKIADRLKVKGLTDPERFL